MASDSRGTDTVCEKVVRSSVVFRTERVPVRALSIQMYSPSRATRGH